MTLDAVVVGSGPNGLAAAITLARAGRSVLVIEANDSIGGAARSGELTRPGFVHDLGAAITPLGVASPFLRQLDLGSHGLDWVTPSASVGHPLDGGRAAIAWHDLDRTVDGLGADGPRYRRVYEPLVERFDDLLDFAMRPVLRVPRAPALAARFGLQAVLPATVLARTRFRSDEARGLFAGHAAHAVLPLRHVLTSTFGLLFGASAHAVGWPFPRGGSQAIVEAMRAVLEVHGGKVQTGSRVESLADLPAARAVVLALTPRQIVDIAGDELDGGVRRRLSRFRYGPGVCKVDFALSEPIPWRHADLRQTATVHVGGRLDEVAAAELTVARGEHAERPFVLVAQQSLFDDRRAPAGSHTAWAYCHVPHGSTRDGSASIAAQIERFAPGFSDVVLDAAVQTTPMLEAANANLVGGDIGGGSYGGTQIVFRPWIRRDPYRLGDARLFIASASTPPGAGVHGMGGHQAAESALRTVLRD